MNLFDAIFKHGSLECTAILFEEQQISYAELREKTILFARALATLGINRGERVALLLNDSPQFISSFIAICSYGAIAVPVNMALRLDEQRAILNDSTASIAIAEADLSKLPADARDKLPHLKQILLVSREEKSTTEEHGEEEFEQENNIVKTWSFEGLMSEATAKSHGSVPETPFAEPGENQPAFILYTSGSTGEPKGAIHSLSDIFYTKETYCRQVLKLTDGDRVFSSSRLPFAYGFGNAFTFPLLNGCTTILCREKPTPEVITRVFARHKPTIFFGVPVIYRLLLDSHKNKAPLDGSSLRLCISAGEALPAQLGEEWEKTFGVPVLDGIGSTEMLHMWMSNKVDEIVYGSSGKLLEGYEARLLDPEGKPSPADTEGNLWVKGASAAIRYWQRPETTAMTFVDGWVRTGDLYRKDAAGYWFHMGRSDDCFKSSGQWVSPVEVEGVLLRHAHVNRAAVVEYFDNDGLPCACAFVIKAAGNDGNAELEQQLSKLAREKLPRFKQPRRYIFVDELPYTATGKVQRFKLREQLRAQTMKTGQ